MYSYDPNTGPNWFLNGWQLSGCQMISSSCTVIWIPVRYSIGPTIWNPDIKKLVFRWIQYSVVRYSDGYWTLVFDPRLATPFRSIFKRLSLNLKKKPDLMSSKDPKNTSQLEDPNVTIICGINPADVFATETEFTTRVRSKYTGGSKFERVWILNDQ